MYLTAIQRASLFCLERKKLDFEVFLVRHTFPLITVFCIRLKAELYCVKR